MRFHRPAFVVLAALAAAGCGDAEEPKPAAMPRPADAKAILPQKPAVDWCSRHGVPASVCTRCDDELVPQFKTKGDWCGEHGLPISQCVACDPALAEKLKAMAPR